MRAVDWTHELRWGLAFKEPVAFGHTAKETESRAKIARFHCYAELSPQRATVLDDITNMLTTPLPSRTAGTFNGAVVRFLSYFRFSALLLVFWKGQRREHTEPAP